MGNVEQGRTLYGRIASELAHAIRTGALGFGDRLPSVRKLKTIKQVSIPTILEALHLLEDQGLIEARHRSGYFVKFRPRTFAMPTAAKVSGRPRRVDVLQISAPILNANAKPGLLPFGAAVPSAELFPQDKLRQIIGRLARRKGDALGSYTFAPGHTGLRAEIARRGVLWGCSLDPQNIVVTNGCVEAVGLALRAVTQPGDIVAIESPCYYGFIQMLEMLHLRAMEIPSSIVDGISLPHLKDGLEKHDIKACLISTTVTNPCGATMPLTAKKSLVSLLSDHDVPLIEDATFADLQFDDKLTAAKSFDESGNVLLCASLTKTVAPGLRIGWIDAGRHSDRVAFMKRVSSIDQPAIIQAAIAEYLSVGGVDRHLRILRQKLSRQVDQHLAAIEHLLSPSIKVCRPSGGFLLWLQWPDAIDTLKLQAEALNLGIGLAPGLLFSATGQFRSHMRINCGQVWTADVERGYRNLAALAALPAHVSV